VGDKSMKATQLIKNIFYPFIPRSLRQRIFWKLQILIYVLKNKNLRLRLPEEENRINNFLNYRQNFNNEQWQEIQNKLSINLNQASRDEIQRFLARTKYLSKHNVIEQNKLFTIEEKIEQKICSRELMNDANKFKKYQFSTLSSECFYGYSGLRWLPKKQQNKIQSGICIDGGAGEGDTAIMLIEKLHAQSVHAFEIEKNNYQKLLATARISQSDKIKPIFIGLSDYSGRSAIIKAGGMSKLSENSTGLETEVKKLDDLYGPNQKISLIKLDIEGAEQSALKGAQNIIQRDHPLLAISIYHKIEDLFQIKPWLESIAPRYKFIIKKASPFLLVGETMLIAYYE